MMMMKMQTEIMGSSSLDQENKIGIMGYDDEDDSFSSDVSSVVSSDDESDDEFDQNNSSSDNSHVLGNMSDLLQQLPPKKGLSKHFQGKSQSFTSLSKVMCLEDLAKPEHPYNMRMKSCKSYVALSRVLPPPTRSASSSKLFTQTTSRSPCSSLSNSSRPPAHPSHSNGATSASGFSNQTPLIV